MDTLTPSQRSERMSRVRSKDSKAELIVRRLVWRLGYRYQLHGRRVLGRPDLVFRGRQSAIFIHGCFWHRHKGCAATRTPKSRVEFWTRKFQQNVQRDRVVAKKLKEQGWKSLIIWECEVGNEERLRRRIERFMDGDEVS